MSGADPSGPVSAITRFVVLTALVAIIRSMFQLLFVVLVGFIEPPLCYRSRSLLFLGYMYSCILALMTLVD
jgi:hypothetical protein